MNDRKRNILMQAFYLRLLMAGNYMGQQFFRFTHPKPKGYYRHISKGLRRFHRVSTGVVKIQRGKEYPVYSCNYHATQKLRG